MSRVYICKICNIEKIQINAGAARKTCQDCRAKEYPCACVVE